MAPWLTSGLSLLFPTWGSLSLMESSAFSPPSRQLSLMSPSPRPQVQIPKAKFSVPLSRVSSLPQQAQAPQDLTRHCGGKHSSSTLAGFGSVEGYAVNVTIGGQKFNLVVDTGSSDTWIPRTGFKCFNLSDVPEAEPVCNFASTFDPSNSPTFELFPNHNMNISYGDDDFLNGDVAFETVSVGGLSVPRQEIGIITNAAWVGDGVTSGILGLGNPNLTAVFTGSDPTQDNRTNHAVYNPFFFNAVEQGLVDHAYFSVALDRGSFEEVLNSSYVPELGKLAFGGIVDVPVLPVFVTLPALKTANSRGGFEFAYYIVEIEELVFPGSEKLNTTRSNITILDTGTTLNYLPSDVAAAYAAAFRPPAVQNATIGGYVAPCSARVPEFEVVIGGAYFPIQAADQLLPTGQNDPKGNPLCVLGTQDGGPITQGITYILGDVFLHNVVVTVEILAHEITLTRRRPY